MRQQLALSPLSPPPEKNVRVPADLYEMLREIKISLESQYQSAGPTMQDLATIALKRLISQWQNPDEQAEILTELLEQRKLARSRMGKR